MLVLKECVYKTGHFPLHNSICGVFIFLSMGQEKGFTSVFMGFSSFRFVVVIFSRVRHSTSHLSTETHVEIIFLDKYFPTQKSVL